MHVPRGLLLPSLHVDIWRFLVLFIVIVKADSHYSFPILTGVTYVENRKERQALSAAFKETTNLVCGGLMGGVVS